MASSYASEGDGVSKTGCNDVFEQLEISKSDSHESKNLGDDILNDLDSYLEDIDDRLTISRMVSDSIIKGMVNAVSQEAAEIVVAKELEVTKLKEVLCYQQFGNSEIDASKTLRKHLELELQDHGRESLGLLNQAVKEQLERLEKCIGNTKGPKYREIISSPSLITFGGDLEESLAIENDLDEAFYCLKAALKALCQKVDVVAFSPEFFIEEWKVELHMHKELEAMVFSTVVQGLQYEYEKQLWDVSYVPTLNYGFNEISSLRHELDSIQKCFVGAEVGNLSPQVSLEMDHLHRTVSSNHGLPSAQLWDGNGKCEESKSSMPETFETSSLKHMSAQDLYQHFRTVITEMKRGNESTVQRKTEECFTLKRELLKERELKKDKVFEKLKKKIPEVMAELDDIVKENKKLSEFCNHSNNKLGSLLSENCHLKGLLNGQKQEVRHLSLQASNAAKELLQHAWAEEKLHKRVGDFEHVLEDERIYASISEEVYKCVIREMAARINSSSEDLDVMSIIMQDFFRIINEEAFHTVHVSSKSDYEEIDLQSSIIQQIYEIVFPEVLGNMSMDLKEFKDKCLKEYESLDFLQRKVSEIENELTMKVKENEKLNHQVFVLKKSADKNDELLHQLRDLHEKEKQEFTKDHDKLLCLRANQEALIYDRNEQLMLLKEKLEDCQKQIDLYSNEVDKLNKELELSQEKSRKSDEDMTNLVLALELKQNYLASLKMKDNEHTEHMKSLCHVIQGFSKSFADFELRIKESFGWHNVRLENSAFQLHSLIPKLNVLRRTGSLYKERLEKKCSDLEKAEAEVDLLGDEVDALLSLLEKIYVALDHYSPILQHYPGIIEILKLVKRELSVEANRAV